jgi:hypothetical protein
MLHNLKKKKCKGVSAQYKHSKTVLVELIRIAFMELWWFLLWCSLDK